MAPELLMGKKYDIKADVWSTGVCLFEMLFGCCPFEEKTIPLLINRLKTSELVIPLNINNVSIRTQNLIRSFLKFNPDHRTTFEKGFQDLKEYFDGENFREIKLSALNPAPLQRQRSDFSGNSRMNYNKILQPKPAFSKEPHGIKPHSFKKQNIPSQAFKKQLSPAPVYTQINDKPPNATPTTQVQNYIRKKPQTGKVTRTIAERKEEPKVRRVKVINRTFSNPTGYPISKDQSKTNYIKVIDKEKQKEERRPSTQQYLEYSNLEDIHQIKDKYNTREKNQKVKSPTNRLPKNTSIERIHPKPQETAPENLPRRPANPVNPAPIQRGKAGAPVNAPLDNKVLPPRRASLSPNPQPAKRRMSQIEKIDQNMKRHRNSQREIQVRKRRNSAKSPLKFDAGAALDRLRGKKVVSPRNKLSEYQSNPRTQLEPVPMAPKRKTVLLVEQELRSLGGKVPSDPVKELVSLLTSDVRKEDSLVSRILRSRMKASVIIDVVRNILEYFRDEFREKQILVVQKFLWEKIEVMERSDIDCTHFRTNSQFDHLEKCFPLESLCYFGSLLLLKKAKQALTEVNELLTPGNRVQLEDNLVNSQSKPDQASSTLSKRKFASSMTLFCNCASTWKPFSNKTSPQLMASLPIFRSRPPRSR